MTLRRLLAPALLLPLALGLGAGAAGGTGTGLWQPIKRSVKATRMRSEKRFHRTRFISETSVVIIVWDIRTMLVLRCFRGLLIG